MRTIDKLKQYKHKESYIEIIENDNKIEILLKQKENSELQLKLEVNSNDEEMIEKICGVLKYYDFSEHRDINSMYALKKFVEKNRYYIGYVNNEWVFITNFVNGAINRYSKKDIEGMHKVNINVI
jgi:hypothetical protein